MKAVSSPGWAEYCLDRLADFCLLRRTIDAVADEATKYLLQKAIFSVYLDCVEAGVDMEARDIVAGLRRGGREEPALEAATGRSQ